MAGPTFSPDGKWMWDGTTWIPAPPPSNVLPQPAIDQQQVSIVANQAGIDPRQLTQTAPYFDQNQDGVLQQSELQQAAMAVSQQPSMLAPNYPPQPLFQPTQMPTAFSDFDEQVLKWENSKSGGSRKFLYMGLVFTACILLALGSWLLIFAEEESVCQLERLSSDYDDPIGGLTDSTTTYTYNSGLLILEEEVSWEGAILDRTTYTYDSSGNLIEEYRTYDSDYYRETMTYDDSGNIHTRTTLSSEDDSVMEIYSYNSNNNLIMEEIDFDIDGIIDSKTINEYGNLGMIRLSYTDEDMDGSYDTSDTYYHNGEGKLIEIKTDDGMDGSIDDVVINIYNSNGNLIEMKFDLENDGSYEYKTTHKFDSQNRLTESISIMDFEGTFFDMRSVGIHTYADDLLVQSVYSHFDGDGDQTSTTTHHYGCV